MKIAVILCFVVWMVFAVDGTTELEVASKCLMPLIGPPFNNPMTFPNNVLKELCYDF